MTNRPSDDFENKGQTDAQDFGEDYGDDDAAAFGSKKVEPVDDVDALEEDFVEDDAADVIDPEADQEYAEYSEEELEADPLAEDAEPYPTTDEIYEGAAPQAKQGMMEKFNSMKAGDKIFYGAIGLLGLGAAYFAFSMTMGEPEQQAVDSLLNVPGEQIIAEGTPALPAEQKAPIANVAEPQPDAVGIKGAQSTLNDGDTFNTLPQPVADTPPAELQATQQQAAAPVIEQQQAAVPTPSAQQAPLPAQIPDEVKAQLEAQQEAMNALQSQIEQQQAMMKQMQEKAAAPTTAPLAQVTAPPPVVQTNDPALNQIATDLGVRIAEVNARLTQLAETMNGLQKTAGKLDEETAALKDKTKDLSEKVGTQSTKISELANKEPPPSTDKAMLEELKSGVTTLEKKLATLSKEQQDLKTAQANVAARAAMAQTVASAAPRTIASINAPKAANDTVNVPNQAPQVLRAPGTTQTVDARSPKARDLAGSATQQPAATTSTWVLRAATPTMAWLSPRPGSAELKRVAPGDTVDGIGQVVEIRQEMGRWVVIGTNGTVR